MNILFVFYIPSGGVETLNRQRAKALKDVGINAHFLYFQKGTGMQNLDGSSETFIASEDSEICKIIHDRNYKAIVVGSDYPFLGRVRRCGYQGALIYEVQGLGINIGHAEKILLQALPHIRAFSDGVLYPKTPHLMKLFETYLPDFHRFCFHNCMDTETFSYQPSDPQPGPIIGWVGRLEANKNWKDFLRIGAKLARCYPALRLWMFEDATLSTDRERKKFNHLMQALNLQKRTTVHANVPHKEMANYFSNIGNSGGFLCSTSVVEGFGYAVLEAMCCRCPVLTTDSDGVKSFVTHNMTGKFFEHGNIAQAVNEGKELMSNTSLREKIRDNGYQHVKKHFSTSEYGENFLNMLKALKS